MRLVAELALVAAAALAVAIALWLLRTIPHGSSPRALTSGPQRPEQLIEIERLVALSPASASRTHAHVRPVLREIASRRLIVHGQTLDRMSDADGRRVLGAQLWELIRPNRPFPENRHGPGITLEDLGSMLDTLEQL